MNLVDLIQATGGLPNDAAGIAAALNAKNIATRKPTPEFVGPALLVKKLGVPTADAACQVFEGAAAVSALFRRIQEAFSAYGLDFADPDTRTQIDTIFTGPYASLGTALKNIGIWNESLADRHNDGVDYTEAEVTAALAEIALRENEAANEQWIAMVRNEFINPAIRTMTKAEIAQAFVDAVEE